MKEKKFKSEQLKLEEAKLLKFMDDEHDDNIITKFSNELIEVKTNFRKRKSSVSKKFKEEKNK